MNLAELDRFIIQFPGVRKMVVTPRFYNELSLTLCSMQRFGANGPATPGSLVAGQMFYRDCEIMTENKNEWETITDDPDMHTLLKNGVLALAPYEYRLQRRKKEKVMPRLQLGDAIEVRDLGATQVIWHLDCKIERTDCEVANVLGVRTRVLLDDILVIHRNRQEIWRRE